MTGFIEASARTSIFQALIDASKVHGRKTPILEDPERSPLSYARIILGAFVLGRKLCAGVRPGEVVGVLLPECECRGTDPLRLRCVRAGRCDAELHGRSRQFALRLRDCADPDGRHVSPLRRAGQAGRSNPGLQDPEGPEAVAVRIVYLEDVRASVTSLDKALGLVMSLVAGSGAPAPRAAAGRSCCHPVHVRLGRQAQGCRAVEREYLVERPAGRGAFRFAAARAAAGCAQSAARVPQLWLDGWPLLPLLSGMKAVMYPSPLHFRQVPKLCKAVGATILFGTDTFLQGWAKAAEPGDLDCVQFVVAGAERVRDQTRAMWSKSGTMILEGYGATECSPVIAVNQTFDNLPGTVGHMLPGMEWRLEPVEGLTEGGKLGRARAQCHARLFARRPARRPRAAAGRLARHRRHRQRRRQRLHPHPRAGQALRQDRRRDGVAGSDRDAGGRAMAGLHACCRRLCRTPGRASRSCW